MESSINGEWFTITESDNLKAVKKIILFSLLLLSPLSQAGIIELSYSYSQTESKIDDDNFTRSLSHTGSLAWYFMQMSALELSFTRGEGQVSGKSSSDTAAIKYRTDLKLYGADLVLTLAAKDWLFQPYIKGGAAWVDKTIYRLNTAVTPDEEVISQTDRDQVVPSLGTGFRLRVNEQFSIKASYDRWRSGNSGDTDIWDSAVRAGVSFMF